MKKITVLALSLFFGSFSLAAQDVFDKSAPGVAQVTIGFPQVLGYGPTYKTTIPAIGLSYDHCIVDDLIDGNASIGVGGLFGIAGSRADYSYSYFGGPSAYYYKYTYFVFGARGTFHYQLIEDLDTYAGVLIGGYAVSSSYEGPNVQNEPTADSGGPLAGGFVGARYYFSDSFSAVAELGYGVAVLNLGVAFRL